MVTPSEPRARHVQASVVREIERALARLGDAGDRPAHGNPEIEVVHEVRKHFKNVRAGLRLLRKALGEAAYQRENRCFRDVARSLAVARDAHALVQTLEKVAPDSPELRDGVLANAEQAQRSLRDSNVFAEVRELGAAALSRLQASDVESAGCATIDADLRRLYRSGRLAFRRAKKDPSIENLHELRKRSQYLRGALELLQLKSKAAKRARRLSRLLGDDHDLAVLNRALSADGHASSGLDARERVSKLIERRREKLQKRGLVLAHRLYRATPKHFGRKGAKVVTALGG